MNTNCAWCVNVLALGSRFSCWSIPLDKLAITFDHLELLGRIWQKLRCCLTTWSAHLSVSPETGIISQAGRLPVRIPYHRSDILTAGYLSYFSIICGSVIGSPLWRSWSLRAARCVDMGAVTERFLCESVPMHTSLCPTRQRQTQVGSTLVTQRAVHNFLMK